MKKYSCGVGKRNAHLFITHGKSNHRVYFIWQDMKKRCQNKTHRWYKNYGGRGINICNEWQSFEYFYKDMGDPPGEKYSIDRINNNLGYFKDNCRWATPSQQANNKRNTIRHNVKGEMMTPREIANKFGINYHTLKTRLNASKMTIIEAINYGLVNSRV